MANIEAVSRGGSEPYHARVDSKPFSYIRTATTNGNASKPGSRTVSRASSREALSTMNTNNVGLESPSILRKIMSNGNNNISSRPTTPTNNHRTTYSAVESVNVAMPLYSTVNKAPPPSGGGGGQMHKTSATILVNGDSSSATTNGKSSLIKGKTITIKKLRTRRLLLECALQLG